LIYPPKKIIVSAQTRLTCIGLTETVLSANLQIIPDDVPQLYM